MKRHVRFMLMLPVIVVPFVTLVFWILDGGKGVDGAVPVVSRFNTQLPKAVVARDSANDKMAFYQVAAQDSSKRAEQLRMDPYRKEVPEKVEKVEVMNEVREFRERNFKRYQPQRTVGEDAREEISSVPQPRKERMNEADPELETINAMLDKLSALQHPKATEPDRLYREPTVEVKAGEDTADDYFGRKAANRRKTFFDAAGIAKTGIVAVIPTAQVLQSGSVVKLELESSITLGAVVLRAGHLLYGVAALSGERLLVNILSVRAGDQLLPVNLSVYDFDGMEGIYVPGSLSREVIKESAEGAIQSTGISGFDLSMKTQVAAAGIGAAKSLLSKKVKAVRVQVEAGYRVLLRDNQQKMLR